MAAVVRASRATGTTAGEVERCDGRGDLTSRVVLGRPAVENFLPSTSRSRTSFKDEDTCYGSRPPWLELLLIGVGGSRTGKRTAIVLARDRKSFSLRRISIQHNSPQSHTMRSSCHALQVGLFYDGKAKQDATEEETISRR